MERKTKITIYKDNLDLSKKPLGAEVDLSGLRGKLVGSEICDDYRAAGNVPVVSNKKEPPPKKTMKFEIELMKSKDNFDIAEEAMK